MLQSVLLYLFYMLLVFVLLSSSVSSNKSLLGEDSKNISYASDASHSTQGDPPGPPKKIQKVINQINLMK